jgi:hypothetical protein
LILHFHYYSILFSSFFYDFFFDSLAFVTMIFNFKILKHFLLLISCLTKLWSQNKFCVISTFLKLLRIVLSSCIWP